MALNPDFKAFIQSLNVNNVRYLVIGGYAVAFHGHPRYTKDLDIWIDPDLGNLKNLISALDHFGFGSLGLSVKDFENPEEMVQLGYPPSRIDLLTDVKGVTFATCYTSKTEVVIDDLTIDVIDLDNLKKNKQATGRLQDLADLENLE